MSEFHDKVINTKNDKIILLHPFHPAMSAKHFVSQLERQVQNFLGGISG
jgi:hypothetical protein